jgi:hypothetical protein
MEAVRLVVILTVLGALPILPAFLGPLRRHPNESVRAVGRWLAAFALWLALHVSFFGGGGLAFFAMPLSPGSLLFYVVAALFLEVAGVVLVVRIAFDADTSR